MFKVEMSALAIFFLVLAGRSNILPDSLLGFVPPIITLLKYVCFVLTQDEFHAFNRLLIHKSLPSLPWLLILQEYEKYWQNLKSLTSNAPVVKSSSTSSLLRGYGGRLRVYTDLPPVAHQELRSSLTLELYKKAYDHIIEHHPFWNRSSGRDHIWVIWSFSWDEGACYAPKEIWSSMMLVHWGNTNSKHKHSTTAYWADVT